MFPKILSGKKKEMLAKSIGLEHLKSKGKVIDMTCGLGSDSLKISFWGGSVISYERNLVSYVLVTDALHRHSKNSINKAFHLEYGELTSSTFQESIVDTVIYYDPMYPDSNKKVCQVAVSKF